MTGTSLFRTLVGRRRHEKVQAASSRDPAERRRPAYRCNGCVVWGPRFIHMSNGGDYCLPCARRVSAWFGSTPGGRRAGDIRTLDEGVDSRAARGEVEQGSTLPI